MHAYGCENLEQVNTHWSPTEWLHGGVSEGDVLAGYASLSGTHQ